MPLENINDTNLLGIEMIALKDELTTLMDQRGLSDKDRQNIKDPIDQICIKALLSREIPDDTLVKIVEEFRKGVNSLKIDSKS